MIRLSRATEEHELVSFIIFIIFVIHFLDIIFRGYLYIYLNQLLVALLLHGLDSYIQF